MPIATELFEAARTVGQVVEKEAPKVFTLFEHGKLKVVTENEALAQVLHSLGERGGNKMLLEALKKDIRHLMENGEMGSNLEKIIATIREHSGSLGEQEIHDFLKSAGLKLNTEGKIERTSTSIWGALGSHSRTIIREVRPGEIAIAPELEAAEKAAGELTQVRDAVGEVVDGHVKALTSSHARALEPHLLSDLRTHVSTWETSVPRIRSDKLLSDAYAQMQGRLLSARTMEEAEGITKNFTDQLLPHERAALERSKILTELHGEFDTGEVVRDKAIIPLREKVRRIDPKAAQATNAARDASVLDKSTEIAVAKASRVSLLMEKAVNKVVGHMNTALTTLLNPKGSPRQKAQSLQTAATMLGKLVGHGGSQADVLHAVLGGKYEIEVIQRALGGSAKDIAAIEHDVAGVLHEGISEVRFIGHQTSGALHSATTLSHADADHAQLASDAMEGINLLDRLVDASGKRMSWKGFGEKPLAEHAALKGHKSLLSFVKEPQAWMEGQGHTLRAPEGRSNAPAQAAAAGR